MFLPLPVSAGLIIERIGCLNLPENFPSICTKQDWYCYKVCSILHSWTLKEPTHKVNETALLILEVSIFEIYYYFCKPGFKRRLQIALSKAETYGLLNYLQNRDVSLHLLSSRLSFNLPVFTIWALVLLITRFQSGKRCACSGPGEIRHRVLLASWLHVCS